MTFLPAQSHRTLLIMQKAQVDHQLQLIMFQTNVVMSEVNAIQNLSIQRAAIGEDASLTDQEEARTKVLDQQAAQLEAQQTSLESEREQINAELQALAQFVKDGIKQSVGLSIMGGS